MLAEKYKQGRPGVILGSDFAVSAPAITFHTFLLSLSSLFLYIRSILSRVTARYRRPYSSFISFELWIVLVWCGFCFSCRVSGHLAGGCLGSWQALPWLLLLPTRSIFALGIPRFTCFTCKTGTAQIREYLYSFFVSHLTRWTNRTRSHWPNGHWTKKIVMSEATLCGNPGLRCQKLRSFWRFLHDRIYPIDLFCFQGERRQKTDVSFAIFLRFRATLCGDPGFKFQKLRERCDFLHHVHVQTSWCYGASWVAMQIQDEMATSLEDFSCAWNGGDLPSQLPLWESVQERVLFLVQSTW